jgi:nucleotide-binding universal stress UspA family protein
MKTILVPTDFSKCSPDAIKYAIHFAEKTDRKLLFFHSTFLLNPTKNSNSTYLRIVKLERELKLKMLGSVAKTINWLLYHLIRLGLIIITYLPSKRLYKRYHAE